MSRSAANRRPLLRASLNRLNNADATEPDCFDVNVYHP